MYSFKSSIAAKSSNLYGYDLIDFSFARCYIDIGETEIISDETVFEYMFLIKGIYYGFIIILDLLKLSSVLLNYSSSLEICLRSQRSA